MASNVSAAIAQEAGKRNCKHWDLFLQSADTSLLDYDDQTGEVRGIQEFFDKHQNDPKYRDVFFTNRSRVIPNTDVPSIEVESKTYKADPLGALRKLRADARLSNDYSKYNALKLKLEREGLLG